RNCSRGVLGGKWRWRTTRDNHVYLQPDQIGREVAETVELSVRISVFDDHVLTFEVTEFAQLLSKRFPDRVRSGGGRSLGKIAYAILLPLRLRPHAARRSKNCSEASDEGATVHTPDLRLRGS